MMDMGSGILCCPYLEERKGNGMEQTKINELLSELTLEEKAGLCSGKDNWFTKAVERLGIPNVRTSDGPHGLRTQAGDVNGFLEETTAPAVCFPTASASAASFDRTLMEQMGTELGKEAQAFGVNVLLGPGVNMKRSPLCGRNFEYFSEDPLLAGELGAAFVNGVQSQGVGTSLKHFFANSQEHRRMDASSELDERTMREIYLPAFETVVKKGKPWTVMASYNKVNGTFSTQNEEGLSGILRKEWGFEGLVMSDWGATHDRAAAVRAGCDLTMPAENTDQEIVRAVEEGTLSLAALDSCCQRVLELAFQAVENRRPQDFDYEGGHALARKISSESMVLLKNEDSILPLEKNARVAFIGGFAEKPRYQGGGSSHINSFKVVGALQAARNAGISVNYVEGCPASGMNPSEEMLAEAVKAAEDADVAVLFVGLPDQMESEGVDRRHLGMPEGHNELIERVCAVNPNTVVVLHNGSPVEMPWVEKPKAILEAYLGGQAVGEATVDVLFGDVNPSGHLAETFPQKLEHNPSYLYYFGEGDRVEYREGIFMGYRYYNTKGIAPLFPFGHGLSYTVFACSDLKLDKTEMKDSDTLRVCVVVSNTGEWMGKALVQLYVAPPRQEIIRPVRELKGFEKIELAPGESREICFSLSKKDFAHWAEKVHDWRVEEGIYRIQICENADTVLLEQKIQIRSTEALGLARFSLNMPMGDFAKTSEGHKAIDENIHYLVNGMAAAGFIPKEALEALKSMGGGQINLAAVEMLADHMGVSVTGNSGIQALFAQPVSILTSFMPQEKSEDLKKLIERLNGEN